jgi:hypothetical protein
VHDDNRVRDDIALIREAIEEGRRYATRSGPGMIWWGSALAAAFAATYASVRGWSPFPPSVLWPLAIAVPWAHWLYRLRARRADPDSAAPRSPMIAALRALWGGLGIFLTSLTLIVLWSGAHPANWLAAVAAGALGTAVFATAWLAGIPWLRWIAVAWWIGELTLFALRDRPEMLLLSAALMLALLAGPGLVLVLRRRELIGAR